MSNPRAINDKALAASHESGDGFWLAAKDRWLSNTFDEKSVKSTGTETPALNSPTPSAQAVTKKIP